MATLPEPSCIPDATRPPERASVGGGFLLAGSELYLRGVAYGTVPADAWLAAAALALGAQADRQCGLAARAVTDAVTRELARDA